jgi:acyl-CoA thioesterase FadM
MIDVLVETTIPTSHTTRVTVGWAATDANAHMRSTAYLDAINDCRTHFFHDARSVRPPRGENTPEQAICAASGLQARPRSPTG